MSEPLYQLKDLSKRYTRAKESITIFSDLTMEIPRGDFMAIMGPSGSGKTTLLNLLGGIDSPSSGEIICDGVRIDKLGQGQLAKWRSANVGFIFQFYNLMPTLNAAQNVELPLLLTRLTGKERKRRVQTALDIVKLSDRAGHHPRQLSGGQQQRVAIARAIVADPAVLLCDEPTGDLDRTTADEILATLRLLNDELGKTVIMVTHDPSAAKYARRELHLDKGRFLEAELGR
jgi:putative ABC transport system ATP-binding protein